MKVCIYSPVSAGEQDSKNQSVVPTGWTSQHGYEVLHSYNETDSASQKSQQRALSHLLDDAWKSRLDAMMVWDLDRLSRDGPLAISP